jgi:hypothetical protein
MSILNGQTSAAAIQQQHTPRCQMGMGAVCGAGGGTVGVERQVDGMDTSWHQEFKCVLHLWFDEIYVSSVDDDQIPSLEREECGSPVAPLPIYSSLPRKRTSRSRSISPSRVRKSKQKKYIYIFFCLVSQSK